MPARRVQHGVALRDEGLDPDDPAAIDLVWWELALRA
jgi:hypothetical protein